MRGLDTRCSRTSATRADLRGLASAAVTTRPVTVHKAVTCSPDLLGAKAGFCANSGRVAARIDSTTILRPIDAFASDKKSGTSDGKIIRFQRMDTNLLLLPLRVVVPIPLWLVPRHLA